MENGENELPSFGTGSALMSKYGIFKSSKGSRLGPWTLTIKAWRFNLESRRVCRPVNAGSHQDPD